MVFQSTPSGGKATASSAALQVLRDVSIHAFRGEGDLETATTRRYTNVFQSTPSGGKATIRSTTLLDSGGSFNPRLPGGRRPGALAAALRAVSFQSTPSGGKATRN